MLPDSFIQELKSRISLEELAGQYVKLKRAGSNTVGCCPFHSEKTPSFTIFSPGDHFYCFGCGAGGDVITFMMRIESLDYISAVEALAERAGLSMPQEDDVSNLSARVDKKRYYEMNTKAAKYFHNLLISPKGVAGMDYLKKRGVAPETINRFGIGYSGESFDGLVGYLTGEGYTAQEMKTAFLAGISQKNGRPYDYFRNRIMFPIIDVNGKVCAFGGRITGDGNPKYLNSSDTPVFKKGRTLFAANFAKNAGEDSIILCEGYMDVIALHAAGFVNSVATLGTAITGDQARLLRRYASRVYLCYDSDQAGQNATKKAISILDTADIKVKVLKLKGAKDPDEYIKTFGREAFRKVINESEGQIEYLFNTVLAGYDISIPEDKLRFARDICSRLGSVNSELEREVYISRLNELTGLDPEILRNEVRRAGKREIKRVQSERIEKDLKTAAGYGDTSNPDKLRFPAASSKEDAIIGILLLCPEYLEDEKAKKLINIDDFVTVFGKKAISSIMSLGENGEFDFSYLAQSFDTDAISTLTKLKLKRAELSDNSYTVLSGLCAALHEEKLSLGSNTDSPEELNRLLAQLREKKTGKTSS